VRVLPPLGYLDFLWLMKNSALVLTDSGGIQEETTILNVPCVTIRDSTERPITIRQGTNVLTGNDHKKIVKTALDILNKGKRRKRIPKYWDGKAASRIVAVLNRKFL
jgi:UDP-N-acetylglucosamine 2-epimerase (non-hydrolysing)